MSSPGPIAIFGITNDTLNLVVSLLLLFFVAVYIALIYWTYSDARRRMEDPMLVGCATAASLFPFIGTVVYMIVRPPEYIEDTRERDLEIAAAEARLHETGVLACPYCNFEIEKSFLRCPSCLRRLKEACNTCGKPLDPTWKLCPYCESELSTAPPPRRRRSPEAATARAPATGERPARRPTTAAESERPARPAREGGERPARAESERPARSSDSASRRPARTSEGRSGAGTDDGEPSRSVRSPEKSSGSSKGSGSSSGGGSGGSRSKKPRARPPSRPPSSSSS